MNKKFWKIYKIIVIILFIIIICTLSVLFFFLISYEKSIPTHQVDDVITWLNTNDKKKILEYLSINNKDINTNDIILNIINYEKGNYYYVKNHKYNNKDNPVYTIYFNNKEYGNVYLKKKNDKNLFNSPRWEIDYLEGFLPEKKTITINVPIDSVVMVNNHKLNESYIVDNNIKTEKIDYIRPYVSIPEFVKYEVKDIYPNSVIVEYKNNKKELINLNNSYTYVFDENLEVLNPIKDYIENFTKNYTRYVVRETSFSSITPYIISSSNAYSFLKDISLTNLWSGNHTPTQFSAFEYTNMQYYNEQAFSVTLNYTYNFSVNGNYKEFPTKVTLYLVNKNNNWYIVGLNT